MTLFLTFLIKSSISLALLYSLFRLVMRNERNHSLNRFLLLGILNGSALIPLLNVQFFYDEIPLTQMEVVKEFVTPTISDKAFQTESIPSFVAEKTLFINPWLLFYILVIVVLFSRLFISIVKVTQIISKSDKRRFRKIVLAVVKDVIQPFTFLNRIVLSERDFKENKDIVVTHELAHIKQMHAVDLVVCELFTVMQFFNPFMWLLRRDLKLIHEYQADEAVLKKGIDAQKYQLLVLEKAVGERRFAMANHFTQKPILKRLKMMKKTKHRRWSGVKIFLFVPLLIVLLQAFARPELITKSDDFIQVRYTENTAEHWLSKWTVANIGHGIYQPFGLKKGEELGEHNKLIITLNRNNSYYLENKNVSGEDLKKKITQFICGVNPEENKTVKFQEIDIPTIGKTKVFKTWIFLSYDKESSVEVREIALRKIGEAYLDARQEKAKSFYDKDYFSLNENEGEIIDQVVPILFGYNSVHVYSPEPVPPLSILLTKNGKINLGSTEYSLDGFESVFRENFEKAKETFNKNGYEFNLKVEVTCEAGVEEDDLQSLKQVLNEIGFQNISVMREASNQIKSQHELTFNEEQNKAKVDRELAKIENQKLKKVVVHLNENKLNFQGKFCKIENIKSEVQKYVEQNPDIKTVELVLHQPDDLSKEIIEKVKEELNKIEGVEVKVMFVEVMLIKKKSPSSSMFEVEVQNDKILLSEKVVSEKELNSQIIDFIMKTGDKGKVSILASKDVSKQKISHVEDILFFAGINPDNIECFTID